MDVITPTNLRKNIFNVFKNITKKNKPVEVTLKSKNGFNDGIVMMDKKEYQRLIELDYLAKTGTLDTVYKRMKSATDDDFVEL